MTSPQSTNSPTALPAGFTDVARRHLSYKWLLGAGGLALLAIAAFSWNWLVAAGIASVVLSVLPCLVMCGLGLCAHKFMSAAGRSQAPSTSTHRSGANSSPQVSSCCGTAADVDRTNAIAKDPTP